MKFLVAKITPSIKVPQVTENLFDEPTISVADHILVSATPYVLGAEEVSFKVVFGELKTFNEKTYFAGLRGIDVKVNQQELSSWGENDEACYTILASKIGVEIISFTEING